MSTVLDRRILRPIQVAALAGALLSVMAPGAAALPINATLFCASYPAAPACATGAVDCKMCHDTGGPPALNAFGTDIKAQMALIPDYKVQPEDFQQHLEGVLLTLDGKDSDGDGVTNGVEITLGTLPGDAVSKPTSDGPGVYDAALALRRLQVTYCGISPTYEQLVAVKVSRDPHGLVEAALDACLASDYWLKEGLPRLADDRIRPQASLGPGGYAEIGDYYYDYRLFVHALSGDRDARDLLTANYHIAEDGTVVDGVIPDQKNPDGSGSMNAGNGNAGGKGNGGGMYLKATGQPLEPEHRAGMMTTRWNIAMMTMFAVLPRNTAAQAYRSYLGYDLAQSQGLEPVAGEPRDVDHAGVKAHDCAACHSTLDPLAYAFSPYMAFSQTLPDGSPRPRYSGIGAYVPAARTWESWGWLFGKPVADLVDWAHQAANSEPFKVNLATMFYRQALGHAPASPTDLADVAALSKALPGDGYSVNRMLHRLVATTSFGAPGPAGAPRVVWKRHKAVANDLARALQLETKDLCKEVGRFSCTDEVYLSSLGGNDPFAKGQYVPSESPQKTTPVALDRVVLAACSQRVDLDAKGTPVVFKDLDLKATNVVAAIPAIDRQTVALYRRLLSRDPTGPEMMTIHDLAVDDGGQPVAAVDVAKLACFVIGTTQDFAFD